MALVSIQVICCVFPMGNQQLVATAFVGLFLLLMIYRLGGLNCGDTSRPPQQRYFLI